MERNKFEYKKIDLPAKFGKITYSFLIIGIILVVLAFFFNPARASFSSLLVFLFLMGLGMCSLFLVALEYLTDAVWSVAYRRITEFMTPLIIIAPIFAIPVLLNMNDVFHWTNTVAVTGDKILQGKAPYLNISFFNIRLLAIIFVMGVFTIFIIRNSRKQDYDFDQKHTRNNVKLSGAFIPFFAIMITVLSIDWLMSLEPHWFSTIFGVYYFSGSLLAAFAVLTLFAVKLKEWKILPGFITGDHFYNLGAFMFAFVNFWAYIAFSQFMLIWYANLPEETFWFTEKFNGSWKFVSIGLILVKFIVPYVALVSQSSKSNLNRLKFISIWIIFAQLYDLYWLVMTTYNRTGAFFGWIELGFIILVAGIVMILFKIIYSRSNLIPVGDPKLVRSIDFHL
jgi:hypothetical protein